MRLAVNISQPAEELRRQGRLPMDCFKCPAWPDVVSRVSAEWPVYVHFPLSVGRGHGDALDTETRQPPDWGKVESLLTWSGTAFVNVHLASLASDFPGETFSIEDPRDCARVGERLLKDLAAVVRRFGGDRVIAENLFDPDRHFALPTLLPQVIRRVVEEAGCGFLLDLSHARLAALDLDLPVEEYIAGLPLRRMRELHVTGIQKFEGALLQRLRRAGAAEADLRRFEGRLMDHLPLTDADWRYVDWAMERIRCGDWARPELVAFEYGGIRSWWESITDAEVLATQVPRLYRCVREADVDFLMAQTPSAR